eukprot:IDg18579t1
MTLRSGSLERRVAQRRLMSRQLRSIRRALMTAKWEAMLARPQRYQDALSLVCPSGISLCVVLGRVRIEHKMTVTLGVLRIALLGLAVESVAYSRQRGLCSAQVDDCLAVPVKRLSYHLESCPLF